MLQRERRLASWSVMRSRSSCSSADRVDPLLLLEDTVIAGPTEEAVGGGAARIVPLTPGARRWRGVR